MLGQVTRRKLDMTTTQTNGDHEINAIGGNVWSPPKPTGFLQKSWNSLKSITEIVYGVLKNPFVLFLFILGMAELINITK